MREILFRGKDFSGVINHSWCFGSLDTTEKDRAVIIYPDRFGNKCRVFVNPDTVGQYTCWTDKNGVKIFDGDIVRHTQNYDLSGTVVSAGIVKWSSCYGGWLIGDFSNGRADMFLANEKHHIEIIGNIHDNPELLKEVL